MFGKGWGGGWGGGPVISVGGGWGGDGGDLGGYGGGGGGGDGWGEAPKVIETHKHIHKVHHYDTHQHQVGVGVNGCI